MLLIRDKDRLVGYQGRADIMLYIATSCAETETEAYENYHIRNRTDNFDKRQEVVLRGPTLIEYDGYASKPARFLALGRQVSEQYKGKPSFNKQYGDWSKAAYMGAFVPDTAFKML